MAKNANRLPLAAFDDSSEVTDDMETESLPILSFPEDQDRQVELLEKMSSQLEELVSLGRDLSTRLERLVEPPKNSKKVSKKARKTR